MVAGPICNPALKYIWVLHKNACVSHKLHTLGQLRPVFKTWVTQWGAQKKEDSTPKTFLLRRGSNGRQYKNRFTPFICIQWGEKLMREFIWNIKLKASGEVKHHCSCCISPFQSSSFLLGFHLIFGCSSLTLSLGVWILLSLPPLYWYTLNFCSEATCLHECPKLEQQTMKRPGSWS